MSSTESESCTESMSSISSFHTIPPEQSLIAITLLWPKISLISKDGALIPSDSISRGKASSQNDNNTTIRISKC